MIIVIVFSLPLDLTLHRTHLCRLPIFENMSTYFVYTLIFLVAAADDDDDAIAATAAAVVIFHTRKEIYCVSMLNT